MAESLPRTCKSPGSLPSIEKNVWKLAGYPSSLHHWSHFSFHKSIEPVLMVYISVTSLHLHHVIFIESFLILYFLPKHLHSQCLKISHYPFQENTLLQFKFNFLSFSLYKFLISVSLELESSLMYYLFLIISTAKIILAQE